MALQSGRRLGVWQQGTLTCLNAGLLGRRLAHVPEPSGATQRKGLGMWQPGGTCLALYTGGSTTVLTKEAESGASWEQAPVSPAQPLEAARSSPLETLSSSAKS